MNSAFCVLKDNTGAVKIENIKPANVCLFTDNTKYPSKLAEIHKHHEKGEFNEITDKKTNTNISAIAVWKACRRNKVSSSVDQVLILLSVTSIQ